MANEGQRQPGENPDGEDVPAEGPEVHASGPEPQEEAELTVEDILDAQQTEDAQRSDEEQEPEAEAAENPYLDDLRRITAEYANYRKRTEANVAIDKQRATAAAVLQLLPVLDDLDRAEQHGDLAEGSAFATIAQKLRGTVERLGVESFGEAGEAFDPAVHEAIAQVPTPGVETPTVLDVVELGYRIGEVELRPAKVAVAVGADG
ncbi:MAG: nucleotide exchange factor GrpE [Leucobacter sp.]